MNKAFAMKAHHKALLNLSEALINSPPLPELVQIISCWYQVVWFQIFGVPKTPKANDLTPTTADLSDPWRSLLGSPQQAQKVFHFIQNVNSQDPTPDS